MLRDSRLVPLPEPDRSLEDRLADQRRRAGQAPLLTRGTGRFCLTFSSVSNSFSSSARVGLPLVSYLVAFSAPARLARFAASRIGKSSRRQLAKTPRKASPHPVVFTTLFPREVTSTPPTSSITPSLVTAHPLSPSVATRVRCGWVAATLRIN